MLHEPIFKSFSRSLPAWALASWVSFSPSRRSDSIRTYACFGARSANRAGAEPNQPSW